MGWLRDLSRDITAKRSPKWPATERAFLKAFPMCQACGGVSQLEVHHKQPFHLHPELELVWTNLITLCRSHHLFVGHLESWQSFNAGVEQDAATWLAKVKARPHGDGSL